MKNTYNFLLALALSLGAFTVYASELEIRDYEFEWRVGEAGKLRYEVVKTPTSIYSKIQDTVSGKHIRITKKEAALLHDALSKSEAIFEKHPNDEKTNDTIRAGSFRVGFFTSPKYGRSVLIAGDSVFSRVSVDERHLETLKNWLTQTPTMLQKLEDSFSLKP